MSLLISGQIIQELTSGFNLHSNMSLLIWIFAYQWQEMDINLHSNMSLLI